MTKEYSKKMHLAQTGTTRRRGTALMWALISVTVVAGMVALMLSNTRDVQNRGQMTVTSVSAQYKAEGAAIEMEKYLIADYTYSYNIRHITPDVWLRQIRLWQNLAAVPGDTVSVQTSDITRFTVGDLGTAAWKSSFNGMNVFVSATSDPAQLGTPWADVTAMGPGYWQDPASKKNSETYVAGWAFTEYSGFKASERVTIRVAFGLQKEIPPVAGATKHALLSERLSCTMCHVSVYGNVGMFENFTPGWGPTGSGYTSEVRGNVYTAYNLSEDSTENPLAPWHTPGAPPPDGYDSSDPYSPSWVTSSRPRVDASQLKTNPELINGMPVMIDGTESASLRTKIYDNYRNDGASYEVQTKPNNSNHNNDLTRLVVYTAGQKTTFSFWSATIVGNSTANVLYVQEIKGVINQSVTDMLESVGKDIVSSVALSMLPDGNMDGIPDFPSINIAFVSSELQGQIWFEKDPTGMVSVTMPDGGGVPETFQRHQLLVLPKYEWSTDPGVGAANRDRMGFYSIATDPTDPDYAKHNITASQLYDVKNDAGTTFKGLVTIPNELNPYDAVATKGNTILVGTVDNPIHIKGDNFINGDLIIKGYVSGRGAIYANGKIFIAGDIFYVNGPEPFNPYDARWGGDAATGKYGSPVAWAQAEELAKTDELRLAARTTVIVGDNTMFTFRDKDKIVQNALVGPIPNADPLKAVPEGIWEGTGQVNGPTSSSSAGMTSRPSWLARTEQGVYNFINNNLSPNSAGAADPNSDGAFTSSYIDPPRGYPVYYSRWQEELWGKKIPVMGHPESQYVYVLAWANDQGVIRDDSGDTYYRLNKKFVVMYTDIGRWTPATTTTTPPSSGGTTTTTTTSGGGYDPSGGGGGGTTTTTTKTTPPSSGGTKTTPGKWNNPSNYAYIDKTTYALTPSYDGNSLYIEADNPNSNALYNALIPELSAQFVTVDTVDAGTQPIIQSGGSVGKVKLVNLDNPAKSSTYSVFSTKTVYGVRLNPHNFATTPLTPFGTAFNFDTATNTATLTVYRGDPNAGGLKVLEVKYQGTQSAAQTYLQTVYNEYAASLGKLLTQTDDTNWNVDYQERNEGALMPDCYLPVDATNTHCNVVQWISNDDYRKLLGVAVTYWDKDDATLADNTTVGKGLFGSQASYTLPLIYPKAGAKDPISANNYMSGDYCWRGLEYGYNSDEYNPSFGTYGSMSLTHDWIGPREWGLSNYNDGQGNTWQLMRWDVNEFKYNVQFADSVFLKKWNNAAYGALYGKSASAGLWPDMGTYPMVLDASGTRLDGKTHLVAPDTTQFAIAATAKANRDALVAEIKMLLTDNTYYQADQANYDAILDGTGVDPDPEVSWKLYNILGAEIRAYRWSKYNYQYIQASAKFRRSKAGTSTYEEISCPQLQYFFTNLKYPNYKGSLTTYNPSGLSSSASNNDQGWGAFWFLTHGQPPRGWTKTVVANTPSLWVYDDAAMKSMRDTRVFEGDSNSRLSYNYTAFDIGYEMKGGIGHSRFAAPMAYNFPGMKRHLIERALQLGWEPSTHASSLVPVTDFNNKLTLDEFGLPHLARRYDIDGDGIPEYFADDRLYDTDGDGKPDSPFDMGQGFIPAVRQINQVEAYIYAGRRIGGAHIPGYSSPRIFGGLAAPDMAIVASAGEMATLTANEIKATDYQSTKYTMSAADQAQGVQTPAYTGSTQTGPTAGTGLESLEQLALYKNPLYRSDPLHNYSTPKHNPAHAFVLRWDAHDGLATWPVVTGVDKQGNTVNLRIGQSFERTFDKFLIDYDYRLTQQESIGLPGLGNQTIKIPVGIRLYYVHGQAAR